ncbi:replication protein RepA, partial [Amaricoccus sp. HAR-UPW-R2A-40]
LRALRTHGFIDWLRRYVPTGREGRGPQVEQTSNAYRLSLPARARQLLGRLGQTPPMPDDFSYALVQRKAELDAYRASLPLDQLALFEVEDDELAQLLASLARKIQERESS